MNSSSRSATRGAITFAVIMTAFAIVNISRKNSIAKESELHVRPQESSLSIHTSYTVRENSLDDDEAQERKKQLAQTQQNQSNNQEGSTNYQQNSLPATQGTSEQSPVKGIAYNFITSSGRTSSAPSQAYLRTLSSKIESLFDAKKLGKNTKFGINILSLDSRRALYTKNSDVPLTPASTTKLFSTFTALRTLGSDYLIQTSLQVDQSVLPKNGIITGNVFLVGKGDPMLSIEDIDQLAKQLKSSGITKITGNIIADASVFDNEMNRAKYSGDNEEVQATGPISGLTLNKNQVTIIATAGKNPGERIRVSTIPFAPNAISVINTATVAGSKTVKAKKGKKAITIQEGTSLAVKPSFENGKMTIRVSGKLRPGTSVSGYSVFSTNPPMIAADALREKLRANGIIVNGGISVQKAPEKTQVIASVKRPLRDVVAQINKQSDNFAAEHVFKMVGGTAKTSCSIIRSELEKQGINTSKLLLNDGCGLSRRNVVAPSVMTHLLSEAINQPFGVDFVNSLAIAGTDGTLKRRLKATSAEGNATAKTGTLKNVSSLAGYVKAPNGERIVFSIIFNGSNVGEYKHIEDKIVELLTKLSPSDNFSSL